MRRTLPTLLLLATATTLTATGCGLLGDDAMAPGDVVRASEQAIDPTTPGTREVYLQLPEGRLVVTVSQPLQAPVDATDTIGTSDLEPDDDADLLAVTWNVTTEGTTTAGRAISGNGTAPGELRLGEAVIDDGWRRSGAVYAAVPAGSEPELAMDFDGLTQTTTLNGQRDVPPAAQPLYDEPQEPEDQPCATPDPVPGLTASVNCRLTLATSPYADGPGWAQDDTPWRVVTLAASLTNVTADDGSTYAATSADGTFTLDDTAPAATVDTVGTDDAGLADVVQVFDGTTAGLLLVVDRSFSLEKRSGDGPATGSYPLRSTTPLG